MHRSADCAVAIVPCVQRPSEVKLEKPVTASSPGELGELSQFYRL